MRRRTTVRTAAPAAVATLVATLVAGLLAGCSGSGSGGSTASSGAAGSGGFVEKGVAPDTVAPSSPSGSSSGPTPSPSSGSSSASSSAVPVPSPTHAAGLRDFSGVTYAVPSGFTENGDYRPLTPLETDYSSHYLVPTALADPKEVIGIYVYTLPAARTVTAKTDVVGAITAYNVRTKAVVSGGIHPAVTPIDGLPGWTETATEPGGYTYVAYWAFGTHHLLQYSCQVGSPSDLTALALACGTTLASLRLN